MADTFERRTTTPDGLRTTSDDAMFSGPLFQVRRLGVDLPDGGHSEFDVVRHPGSVATVALDEAGRVLLVRQWRPSVRAAEWELPAGIRDEGGEPPQDTAERELREEAGVRADTWQPLLVLHTSPGFTDERVEIFLATGAREEGDPDREPAEAGMTTRWAPLHESVDAVLRGDITNALTVAGLLAASRVSARR